MVVTRSASGSGRNEEKGQATAQTAPAVTVGSSLPPSQSTSRYVAPEAPLQSARSMEPTASTSAASATSTGTNILTSNTPTTDTDRTQPTSTDTLATVTEVTGGSPVEKKTVTSKRSKRSKKSKIAQAELELLRIQARIAEAELRRLREEEDSSDSEAGSEITAQHDAGRVESWVMDTTLLAIADRPHVENNSLGTQAPAGIGNPAGQPQVENYSLGTQAPAGIGNPAGQPQVENNSLGTQAPDGKWISAGQPQVENDSLATQKKRTIIEQVPAATSPPGTTFVATNAQPLLGTAANAVLFTQMPEDRRVTGEQSAMLNREQYYKNSANIVNSERIVKSANIVNSENIGCSAHVNSVGCSAYANIRSSEIQEAPANRYVHNFNDRNIVKPGASAPAGVIAGPPRVEMGELASAIAQAIRTGTQSTARRFSQLPIYSGAYQEWLAFKASYEESASAYSDTENVGRLRLCLKGRAREAVESLLIYNVQPDAIMKSLESRFGRPDTIALAELDRLRSLSRPADSPRDLCVFANRVANVVATLQALHRVHFLHNLELTKITIEKLSSTLKYKWYEYASEQTTDEPDLIKLARFLNREAARCSPYAQPETEPSSSSQRKQNKAYTVDNRQEEKPKCPACERNHSIIKCQKLIDSSTNDRWDMAKRHRLCFRCLKLRTQSHQCPKKECAIDGCQRWHHPLLHFQRKEENNIEKVASSRTLTESKTFLKIVPITASGPKGEVKTYALLDDGSTVTLVDEDIANAIGATGPNDPLRIESIADATVKEMKSRRITLQVTGTDETHDIQARTVKSLKLSPQSISYHDIENVEHLRDVMGYVQHRNAKPRILIGQDNWHLLVTDRMKIGEITQPAASLTPLGWVLHGSRTRSLGHRVQYVNNVTIDDSMNSELRHHFAIESLMITPKCPANDPEQRALKILRESTTQRQDGHYETALLWKEDNVVMPCNRDNTLRRMYSTERKIDRDSNMKKRYETQMTHLIDSGYAERVPQTTESQKTWYLPHFAVINAMKPDKLRVVLDAAAKTAGTSLNDKLLTGPDLLQSLPGVLMRFRQHRIAVSADIAEMFLQVKIQETDRDALRYLWREDRRGDQPPGEYRMNSLIFGATSSPATAIFVKDLNAHKYSAEYPAATTAIVKNHYMDDYLQSFQTTEEAIVVARQVKDIQSKARFNLRQWTSNSTEVLEALEPGQLQMPRQLDDGTRAERTLGIMWNPATDRIAFNLDMTRLPPDITKKIQPTKRELLKILMSVFDPLGFASPVTTRAKQLLQEIWRRGTGWDDPIPKDIEAPWEEWLTQLKSLKKVNLPRSYRGYSEATRLELHTFVDASEAAYAAVLYWRAVTATGVEISLIAAKARVAPLKLLSIPRLELQAAVIGSRMAEAVVAEHDRKPDQRYFWTDSRTVLTWLRTGARSYKPFVAHRIAAIEEHSEQKEWRWIPTKLNVADDATRNIPTDFTAQHRWYVGPEFLRTDPATWPAEEPAPAKETGEERTHSINIERKQKSIIGAALPDPDRFSKYQRLLRTTARVLQFIEILRQKTERVEFKRTIKNRDSDPDWRNQRKTAQKHRREIQPTTDSYLPIDGALLRRAEQCIVKARQEHSFSEEIKALKAGKNIQKNSRLNKLEIEMKDEILVIKTRIGLITDVGENTKSPPILDGNDRVTKLYIEDVHRQMMHAGVETTINECRQHFWILRLRTTARMVIHRCLPCHLRKALTPQPATGNHPPARLAHHSRPFTHTGVDYFGPLAVRVGRATAKRYVALFTCLTTRAVHLELASDLSTSAAVMALRRMIARRGCPIEIWSDNGTNRRGADKELRAALDSATACEASSRGITWRFIPPGAPFMGGAWERMVRSVKIALAATLCERHPNEEVLLTLLAEVENIVNSRPLTHVSVDPDDPEALTPNHFLLLGPGRTPALGPFTDGDLMGRSHWRASQRLADIFWARWLKEYLPELQHRRHTHSVGLAAQVGDLVLIADSNLPRNTWPRGVIAAVYPGADGIVRAIDVRTKGGVLRRPTKKVIILPRSEPSSTTEGSSAHDGATGRRENVTDEL